MKSKKLILLGVFAALFQQALFAQEKLDIQFGKVAASDFDLSSQKFDSGSNAVIIADIGKTSFEGNRKSGMTMIFTRFMRVKILNKNGFDIADNRILLYHNGKGDEEKITELKGSTFNLENGRVSEAKLDEKSVFTERYDKHRDITKFTLPDLRQGSVYDITYTIKSDFFFNLRPWSFQGDYPRLWSEYETTIPPVFHYATLMQGDDHFDLKTSKDVYQHFTIIVNNGTEADDFYELSGDSRQQRWVKKNVPALKEEPYTSSVDNYRAKLSFQLHYLQWTQESERHDYLTDWFKASEKLMNDEDFGMKLNHDNAWMSSDVKINTDDCKSDEEKIKKIYAFVRDNFSCTSHEGLYAQSSLKDVYKKKAGSVAEINLLLTAMLRQAHITADPVILSTRSNGVANQSYPLMEEFNYVICEAYSGDKKYTLDASEPLNGFGHLVSDCYNGEARIVNQEKPYIVNLSPDSLRESKTSQVFIVNDEKGFPVGSFETTLGNEESYALREEIKRTTQKDYFKKLQARYGADASIENTGIDSLSHLEDPVSVHYDFDLKNLLSGDVVYFNPMMDEIYKNNPFKSSERHYPVEMPYKMDELYVLSMDIPKGYIVDEIPKSAKVSLNESDGIFEYLIQKNETNIQMRVHLKLNKAYFPVADYPTLRDFFAYVVKKENEQIVFKKIP
ncbi:MAG: DUF3858 domain-containing protein [Bacteroidota bacterium]|nr:DUF3858 domain-containing protein [Bacteroidota bacterium]MDP4249542.1 DUF3858 domain-containing protein [Bacteroidota bacterium]